MQRCSRFSLLFGLFTFAFLTAVVSWAYQDPPPPPDEPLPVAHAECSYFSGEPERFMDSALLLSRRGRPARSLSRTTRQVAAMLAIPGGSRTYTLDRSFAPGSIDSYIWADFETRKITPAPRTTDWEFVRRVTFDLTGRPPTPDRAVNFVNDGAENKRAKLIDELIASQAFVDKWTMFYGDLFQNSDNKPSTGVRRYPEGRNAFYSWIREAIAKGKPYNEMASELISANGASNYTDGPTNWLIGARVGGGPNQDIWDSMAKQTSETFLGIAHMDCLLCHNGRGHVDTLSLWAGQTTRYQAWQWASYFARTTMGNPGVTGIIANSRSWNLVDNYEANVVRDYALNTTVGNRPARVAPAGCRSGQPCYYVRPAYVFGNGAAPALGANYRAAAAKSVTEDFQFARAAVNYVWAEFFGRGIVDPPNLFDPARLDPDNPPPAPWTLQPSNARLLNALAQHFIDSGYNLKALMTEIANSDVYQLSSRYDGEWNTEWEPYFARKYVRRLWAEEIHDAIAQTSGAVPTFNVANFSALGYGPTNFAMQSPEAYPGIPDNNVGNVLDSYLRGNRDDQPRKREGSILQALNMMNGPFVQSRLANMPLITQNISKSNPELVNLLFLSILSRYPSSTEFSRAVAALPTALGTARTNAVQDLVWTLYNKVDFVFNY